MDTVSRAKFIAPPLLMMLFLSVPSFAQMDFSGVWTPNGQQDASSEPYVGNWFGIPMNKAAMRRAEIWEASIQTLPEWQCRPHSGAYIKRGPSQLRITKEVDPVSRRVTAYHAEWLRSVDHPIYLDGRPHPPEWAEHTWSGFSTAEWVGTALKVTTTHLKEDYYRRNGVPQSDKATLTEYWIRRGDFLTWMVIAYDPVYLTEPLVRSTEYRLTNNEVAPYPCTVVEEVDRPRGVVPSIMPGENTGLTEFLHKGPLRLPDDTIRGGAETMYPEFRLKLKPSASNEQ
ncbi:MAG TPA: hypothetical protein VE422_31600 [Terriglobia bacterium]|nr:hypothetical protein [Terriglobia bacterium]